jgi:Leucine-rich repeat (LRR) protein
MKQLLALLAFLLLSLMLFGGCDTTSSGSGQKDTLYIAGGTDTLNIPAQRFVNLANADLTDIGFLDSLTGIEWLYLGGNPITDLAPISNFSKLTYLNLAQCNRLSNLAPISNLTALTFLNLQGCGALASLTNIGGLTNVRSLNIGNDDLISDISPIIHLVNLEIFSMAACTLVTSIAPCSVLVKLTDLDVSNCVALQSLTGIAKLTKIRMLNISGCAKLTDFAPVAAIMDTLDTLRISKGLMPDSVVSALISKGIVFP